MADIELPNPEDIEEQKKDNFTKMVALTVAIYAVVLAIASLGGSNAAKETNLKQQQASNMWAYYQAKVIREHEYRIAHSRLRFDMKGMPSERQAEASGLLDDYAKKIQEYGGDKNEIKEKAEGLEKERDVNLAKDPYFDYAEVFLQIAIVLASVSMLANSRPVFGGSLVLAFVGGFLTLNGYTLWIKLPFME